MQHHEITKTVFQQEVNGKPALTSIEVKDCKNWTKIPLPPPQLHPHAMVHPCLRPVCLRVISQENEPFFRKME